MKESLGRMLHKTNPDLYSEKDANKAVAMIKDRQYILGNEHIDTKDPDERGKAWSMSPEVFEEVTDIIDNAKHIHVLPFIMGTYSMNDREMRMNDICATDPLAAGLAAGGVLESFATPILRGTYFLGRPSWWRHESIHARHHHQMASYLEAKDNKKRSYGYWNDESRLEQAAHTIHEAGIEELLTRWQSLKESPGKREKAMSAIALLLYAEYTPFTGLRNMLIDLKDGFNEAVQDGKMNFLIKAGAAGAAIALPWYTEIKFEWTDDIAKIMADETLLPQDRTDALLGRGLTYSTIAVISALFSTKNKGEFENKYREDGKGLRTPDYKFPYSYSPIKATTRSFGLARYLGKVWDSIPNYRELSSKRDIGKVEREVEAKLDPKLSDKARSFTMNVLDDAMSTYGALPRSEFPAGAYIKERFVPAMYLRLSELYNPTSPRE